MRHRQRLGLVSAFVAALVTAGCADYDGLLFVQDDRLSFTEPEDYEQVETPFTLSWTMEDFEVLEKDEDAPVTEDSGSFVVFIDQAPVEPGETLEAVGKDDPQCEADPRCPNRVYLNAKGVYPTRKTSLTLGNVPPLASKEEVQLHQATVILLDAEGRRIGEYAWYRQFKMRNLVTVG